MSASWARSAAQRAQQASSIEDKLDELAKAIGYIADALRDLENKVDHVQSRVNSLR